MSEITIDHIKKAYDVAKRFKAGKLNLNQASDILVKEGMNLSSARGYIYTYVHLSKGEILTRTINTTATDYYLNQIWKDEGTVGLKKALYSLLQHFEYYENTSGASMKSQRKVYDKYSNLLKDKIERIIYPDEVENDKNLLEGATKTIQVNSYERNTIARKQCIEHFGATCNVCEFDFKDKYGEIGAEFIHVHHKVDISTIGKEYSVNPETDLIPVCPNCHSMLHKKKPAYSVKELKDIISANRTAGNNGSSPISGTIR